MDLKNLINGGRKYLPKEKTFGEEFNFVLDPKPMLENELDIYAENYLDMIKARIGDIFKGNVLEAVSKYGTIPGDIRKAGYAVEKIVNDDKFDNNESVVIGMPYGLQDRIDLTAQSLTPLPKLIKQAIKDVDELKETLNYYMHNKEVKKFNIKFKTIKPLAFEVKLSENSDTTQTTVGRLFGNANNMIVTYRILKDVAYKIDIKDIEKLGKLSDELQNVAEIFKNIQEDNPDVEIKSKEIFKSLVDNTLTLSHNVTNVGKYLFVLYALSESLVDLVNNVRDW